MSKDAMLPCIGCGKVLANAMDEQVNQPSGGTEFTSYGHYGSTFWDAFNGEQIVINVCDECLRTHAERVARQKRYINLAVDDPRGTPGMRAMTTVVGRQWVSREMVPYFDGPEDVDHILIEPEEIGTLTGYDRIEWINGWQELKVDILAAIPEEDRVP